MKKLIKKILGKKILSAYHLTLALLAAFIYGQPSRKLKVIGITGTSGKSSTCEILVSILEEAGLKVGLASTVRFQVANKSWMNAEKMTMVGRFKLQKLLRQMVLAGCQYALIEVTSEGILQHRQRGIQFDLACFTNLYPEHIESHGSFDKYKNTKLKLFKGLAKSDKRPTIIVANLDDKYAVEFLAAEADKKIGFTLSDTPSTGSSELEVIAGRDARSYKEGISFKIDSSEFKAKLLGEHNVYNSLSAIAMAQSLGIDFKVSQAGLTKMKGLPGRIEFIETGQPFKVIVDYAFEPKAMQKLYDVVKDLKSLRSGKIIQVLGSTGGGRDKSRREVLGKMSGEFCDYVVVTDEDPYDEDPEVIIDSVIAGAKQAGKELDKDLFKELDRRDGIAKGLFLAKPGDIVLVTGKGSEQAMVTAKGKIGWDDRKVVREELKKLKKI